MLMKPHISIFSLVTRHYLNLNVKWTQHEQWPWPNLEFPRVQCTNFEAASDHHAPKSIFLVLLNWIDEVIWPAWKDLGADILI